MKVNIKVGKVKADEKVKTKVRVRMGTRRVVVRVGRVA